MKPLILSLLVLFIFSSFQEGIRSAERLFGKMYSIRIYSYVLSDDGIEYITRSYCINGEEKFGIGLAGMRHDSTVMISRMQILKDTIIWKGIYLHEDRDLDSVVRTMYFNNGDYVDSEYQYYYNPNKDRRTMDDLLRADTTENMRGAKETIFGKTYTVKDNLEFSEFDAYHRVKYYYLNHEFKFRIPQEATRGDTLIMEAKTRVLGDTIIVTERYKNGSASIDSVVTTLYFKDGDFVREQKKIYKNNLKLPWQVTKEDLLKADTIQVK